MILSTFVSSQLYSSFKILLRNENEHQAIIYFINFKENRLHIQLHNLDILVGFIVLQDIFALIFFWRLKWVHFN